MFKLTKGIINCELVSHLNIGKRRLKCKVSLWQFVRAIFKRLKTDDSGDNSLCEIYLGNTELAGRQYFTISLNGIGVF